MLPVLAAYVAEALTPIVASVVADRLQKFGAATDFTKVMIDADRKVRVVVPGDWMDEAAVKFVNAQIRNVQNALADTGENAKILKFVAAGDWAALLAEIKRHAFPSADVPAAA